MSEPHISALPFKKIFLHNQCSGKSEAFPCAQSQTYRLFAINVEPCHIIQLFDFFAQLFHLGAVHYKYADMVRISGVPGRDDIAR